MARIVLFVGLAVLVLTGSIATISVAIAEDGGSPFAIISYVTLDTDEPEHWGVSHSEPVNDDREHSIVRHMQAQIDTRDGIIDQHAGEIAYWKGKYQDQVGTTQRWAGRAMGAYSELDSAREQLEARDATIAQLEADAINADDAILKLESQGATARYLYRRVRGQRDDAIAESERMEGGRNRWRGHANNYRDQRDGWRDKYDAIVIPRTNNLGLPICFRDATWAQNGLDDCSGNGRPTIPVDGQFVTYGDPVGDWYYAVHNGRSGFVHVSVVND